MTPIFVALAGSLGAATRFVVDGHIKARFDHTFPWATLTVNVTGSLLLGFMAGILLRHHNLTESEAIIGIGFCGGYTTFSTASFETVRLLEQRSYGAALGNAVGTLIMTAAAAAIGIIVGRLL